MALVAQEKERWPLAGDQLYVDFDLSVDNIPPGTRLSLGAAVIQITEPPHTGCKKYAARFGLDALKFVNSPGGQTASVARRQRQGHSPGRNTGWRRREEAVSPCLASADSGRGPDRLVLKPAALRTVSTPSRPTALALLLALRLL